MRSDRHPPRTLVIAALDGVVVPLAGHRAVGGAEENRLRGELANSTARADRLIVDFDVRMHLDFPRD